MTPIFTTLPEICAPAVPAPSASSAAAVTAFIFILGFICFTPLLSLSKELHTQVFMEHSRPGFELCGRERLRDASVLHHVMPVRERRREPEIRLHQHDR